MAGRSFTVDVVNFLTFTFTVVAVLVTENPLSTDPGKTQKGKHP